MKKRKPNIFEEHLKMLESSIYALKKKAIESYIDFYQPDWIENLFNIKKDEIEKYYSKIQEDKRGTYLELKKFLRIHKKKFKKTEHDKHFIEAMKLEEVNPEISELLLKLMRD